MARLQLYNTISKRKEEFIPNDPEHIKFYACGPTVYSYAHIGNARMNVVCDQLARILRVLYKKVTYVSNITDVDDKIIQAAQENNRRIEDVTNHFARIYNEDMQALGSLVPDLQPRATEYIDDMILFVERLLDKGHAYEAQGHVLFDVSSYPAYGALSGRSQEELKAGARVEVADFKRNASDFVLWKPSQADQPGWDSPWGFGRPGWHLECSAMSESTLGLPIDIHGGGIDLVFPHHENEIAQSCCSTGILDNPLTFARYWFHNGHVNVEGEKMSKSLGNVILVHDLIQQHSGETLRLALLSTHYRQPLNWTKDGIVQAQRTLDRIYRYLLDSQESDVEEQEVPDSILHALCDDLNTSKAITELCSLATQLAKTADRQQQAILRGQILAGGNLLGILSQPPASWLGYSTATSEIESLELERMIEERATARKNRNFQLADEIRNSLKLRGIELEDTPEGTIWKLMK